MLTPFDENREIDWDSLERLVEWYIAAGVHGPFVACQSSKMFYLSDAETVRAHEPTTRRQMMRSATT